MRAGRRGRHFSAQGSSLSDALNLETPSLRLIRRPGVCEVDLSKLTALPERFSCQHSGSPPARREEELRSLLVPRSPTRSQQCSPTSSHIGDIESDMSNESKSCEHDGASSVGSAPGIATPSGKESRPRPSAKSNLSFAQTQTGKEELVSQRSVAYAIRDRIGQACFERVASVNGSHQSDCPGLVEVSLHCALGAVSAGASAQYSPYVPTIPTLPGTSGSCGQDQSLMMGAVPGQQFPLPHPGNFLLQQPHVSKALTLLPPPLTSYPLPATWHSGNQSPQFWTTTFPPAPPQEIVWPVSAASVPLQQFSPTPAAQESPRLPSVTEELRAQIAYYFSKANLQHDMFLRRQMDVDGYVSLLVLSRFPRVQSICARESTFHIINYLQAAIEISYDLEMNTMATLVRRKNDWFMWVLAEP